eukprot:Skav228599  [mRNA]  locus=scaffold5678:25598:41057:+ [translate_table: standard]
MGQRAQLFHARSRYVRAGLRARRGPGARTFATANAPREAPSVQELMSPQNSSQPRGSQASVVRGNETLETCFVFADGIFHPSAARGKDAKCQLMGQLRTAYSDLLLPPRTFQFLTIQHKSDAIRCLSKRESWKVKVAQMLLRRISHQGLALLLKYGGVWLDTTTLMTHSLESLLGTDLAVRTFFSLPPIWEDQTLRANDTRVSWKDHAYNWFLESPPGDLFMRRVKDCAWQFLNGGVGMIATFGGLVLLADFFAEQQRKSNEGRDPIVEGGHLVLLGLSSQTKQFLEELLGCQRGPGHHQPPRLLEALSSEILPLRLAICEANNAPKTVAILDTMPKSELRSFAETACPPRPQTFGRIVILDEPSLPRDEADAITFGTLLTLRGARHTTEAPFWCEHTVPIGIRDSSGAYHINPEKSYKIKKVRIGTTSITTSVTTSLISHFQQICQVPSHFLPSERSRLIRADHLLRGNRQQLLVRLCSRMMRSFCWQRTTELAFDIF